MIDFLKRIFGLSGRSTRLDYDADLFASIDVDRASQRLNVIVRAQEDGRAEVPNSAAKQLSASEEDIVNFFEDEALSVSRKVIEKVQTYTHEINKSKLDSIAGAVTGIFDDFCASIRPLISQHRDHLTGLKSREDVARDEVKAFRHANQISRAANYPESKFFLLSVLFLILIGEAALNGVFFAKGSELGLLGGVSQAFITAGINIAVAWMIGQFLIPQLHHVSTVRKSVGAIAIAIFCLWAFSYNLFVGHFRDAVASSLDVETGTIVNVGIGVVDNMLAAPFALQDFDSWLLVVLGLVFAIIAVLDGYKFDDPYPGYGAVSRRLEQAASDYAEDKQALLQELATSKDFTLQNLDEFDEKIVASEKRINDFMMLSKRLTKSFESYLGEIESKVHVVLTKYRDANQKVRRSDPPIYFNDKYKLRNETSIKLPELPEQKRVDSEIRKAQKVLSKIRESRILVQNEYSTQIDNLHEQFRTLERL